MEELKIKTDFHPVYNDIVIIQLGGYIDQTNSGQIERIINDILKTGKKKFIFDFGGLIYMSSAGWGVFVGEIKMVRDQGGDIKIAAMSPEVYEVFQMLEFYHIIKEYITIDEAVDSYNDGMITIKKIKDKRIPETESESIEDLLLKSGVKASSLIAEDASEKIVLEETAQPEVIKTERTPASTPTPQAPPRRVSTETFHPGSFESNIDITTLPLMEKIKKLVANYPLLSIWQIRKMLQHDKFGNVQVSIFKLYSTLKFLNLHNKKNRYRFYRSI